jgi:hypothetical protein
VDFLILLFYTALQQSYLLECKMSAIVIDASGAPASGSWLVSLVGKLLSGQPKHPRTSVQQNTKPQPAEYNSYERETPVNLNSALQYECDNWLRWTRI